MKKSIQKYYDNRRKRFRFKAVNTTLYDKKPSTFTVKKCYLIFITLR